MCAGDAGGGELDLFQSGRNRGPGELYEMYGLFYSSRMAPVTTYSDVRANLKSYCDEVVESCEPLVIQRRSGANVALISVVELAALEETAHLLRSPKNAHRLLESLVEVRGGGGELSARPVSLLRPFRRTPFAQGPTSGRRPPQPQDPLPRIAEAVAGVRALLSELSSMPAINY